MGLVSQNYLEKRTEQVGKKGGVSPLRQSRLSERAGVR